MAIAFQPTERIVQEYERAIRKCLSSTQAMSCARQIAARMVQQTAAGNARSWRTAAMRATRSREIREALARELRGPVYHTVQNLVLQNAQLIHSVPGDIAEQFVEYIARQQQKGMRAHEIERQLKIWAPSLTRSRIRLIARTEVGKAETALTRARSQEIGAEWFQWLSAHDERVRLSHRNMDHVLVNWNDPPSPEALAHEPPVGHYLPGGIWNCRCIAAPLISLDEVSWPARVYSAGGIHRMTRVRFVRAYGNQALPHAA